MKIIYTLLLFYFLSATTTFSKITVTKTGNSVVDTNALTIDGGFGQAINGLSFQQDAVASFKGYQYVGYYDSARHVCLARRKLTDGMWEILRFLDYDFTSNDAHNIISIGICPQDGTIHLAFDHHGHELHFRSSKINVATKPEKIQWGPSLFGKITSELEKGRPIKITYPRFWQTPQGGLQFCYRQGGSGNGDRMLVDYSPKNQTWKNTRQIDSRKGLFKDELGESDSRCSYPNGYTYGPNGILFATWVWREKSQGSNHDLVYVYSKDQGYTWLNNIGEVLDAPAHINSESITVANISRLHGLMNTHGQAVDSHGRIHVVMWHCDDQSLKDAGVQLGEKRWGPPEARRYFHYWRDKLGNWKQIKIPGVAGNRPKLFIDKNDNLYLIYGAQESLTNWYDDIFFAGGDLVIAAASAKSNWTDWHVVHAEKGPFINEMLGDYYRWKKEGVLSILVQDSPKKSHDPTPLRIVDFTFQQ